MLLSKQQRYVLDVLRRLGCVRKNQLEALLKARFFPPEKAVPPGFLDAMLRQFRCGDVEVRRQRQANKPVRRAPRRRPHRPRRALAPRREQGRACGGPAFGRRPPAGTVHPQHGILRPAAERRLPPFLCPGRKLT